MTFKLQLVLIISSIFFLLLTLRCIKKKFFLLRYALLWLIFSFIVLIISFFPRSIDWISELLGIYSPVNALFLVFISGMIILLFTLTIVISRLSTRVRLLNQELSLIKAEKKDVK